MIFLSGCNTGLELNGECVAHSLATSFLGTVYGAAGYLSGTYAEQTEQTVAVLVVDGIVYHSYPKGRDASGREVWNRFGPPPSFEFGKTVQIKIATSGFRPVSLAGAEAQELIAEVERLVETTPARSARVRMAPDLTFAIKLPDGEHVFELLAGGTVLRDPVTRNVWQFDRGRDLLFNLLPYRTVPAA